MSDIVFQPVAIVDIEVPELSGQAMLVPEPREAHRPT
jgi:hypothetical protein